MDKPDRRIEKTKAAIYEALSDLMQEKKYANITVQEIIDRANVGRTTFYTHFAYKDEVLSSCIESIFESFNQHMNAEATAHENRFLPVAELFAHIQENARLVNGILKAESGEWLFNKFKGYWNDKIRAYLTSHLSKGKQPKVPIDILINYITSTVIELIKWSMTSGEKYTPKQMEDYVFALILPSISSVLSA